MSATFIERCIHAGDYENDGGAVDLDEFENCLVMFESGILTATAIKNRFGATEPQKDDIQDILDTMPVASLTLNIPLVGLAAGENVLLRAQWVRTVRAVLSAGLWAQDSEATDNTYLDAFDTAGEIETALGV